MTRLAALVGAFPLPLMLISERYLTAGWSQSLQLGARQEASKDVLLLQSMRKEHMRALVSV